MQGRSVVKIVRYLNLFLSATFSFLAIVPALHAEQPAYFLDIKNPNHGIVTVRPRTNAGPCVIVRTLSFLGSVAGQRTYDNIQVAITAPDAAAGSPGHIAVTGFANGAVALDFQFDGDQRVIDEVTRNYTDSQYSHNYAVFTMFPRCANASQGVFLISNLVMK